MCRKVLSSKRGERILMNARCGELYVLHVQVMCAAGTSMVNTKSKIFRWNEVQKSTVVKESILGYCLNREWRSHR